MDLTEIMDYVKRCKTLLVPTIMILVILRISILALDTSGSALYIVRQIVCTVAWLGVAYFMFNCSLDFRKNRYEKERIRYMKQVAFWASLACVARCASTVAYYWPLISNNMVMSAHNITELATWALLAVFFGCYWRVRARQDKNM